MKFAEEPYLHFKDIRDFGSALDVAVRFLSPEIRTKVERLREVDTHG